MRKKRSVHMMSEALLYTLYLNLCCMFCAVMCRVDRQSSYTMCESDVKGVCINDCKCVMYMVNAVSSKVAQICSGAMLIYLRT